MKLADDADDNNDFAAGICRVQYIHSVCCLLAIVWMLVAADFGVVSPNGIR